MSGAQRFVCGMRRFDKHRMDSSCSTKENTQQASELQQRLRHREEQDRILFSPSSVSSSSVSSVPSSSPSVSSIPSHTPWKTPSAIYTNQKQIEN